MTTKINILPPSTNNMTVRVFMRAAGLPFEEANVYGQTRSDDYLAKCPAHLTPSIESDDLPKRLLWESCAIMAYLANKHGNDALYPKDPERRATVDSANFYHTGSLYPVLARACYPKLGFGGYPGEVVTADVSDEVKEAGRKAAEAALPEILDVFKDFFIGESGFIGGDSPTIADIRLASTLEFLRVLDVDPPAWVDGYVQRVEKALGDAYREPAADVRGYVAHVRGQG